MDPFSPEFGATAFGSDPGSEGGQFPFGDAYTEYFEGGRPPHEDKSTSVRNLGDIIQGVK